jgi:hypothetical protein
MSFLGPLLSGGASALLGGLFAGKGTKEKQIQPQREPFQRELIDQLLQGLQGQGPLANLFQADAGAFQQGVVDPLLQQFQTQTAPGIQQKFIQSGQQRGTPLESSLARAGLDVQGQINQQFLPFQQGAQNRQQEAIKQLLGLSPLQPTTQTDITGFGGALRGLDQSGAIPKFLEQLFKPKEEQQQQPIIASAGGLPAGGTQNRAGFSIRGS